MTNYLVSSIMVNIFFLLLGINFFARKGGVAYLSFKISSMLTVQKLCFNSHYFNQLDEFKIIEKSPYDIIFLGDSITEFGRWTEFFGDLRIKNRGIAGDTTYGILNRLNEILEAKPTKIFLMIGINDLKDGLTVSDVLKNYRSILTKLRESTPETEVFIQSVLPIQNKFSNQKRNNKNVVSLNLQLQKLAREFSFQYIDLFTYFLDNHQELNSQYTSDGIHLNGRGYLTWKKIIEKYVLEDLYNFGQPESFIHKGTCDLNR